MKDLQISILMLIIFLIIIISYKFSKDKFSPIKPENVSQDIWNEKGDEEKCTDSNYSLNPQLITSGVCYLYEPKNRISFLGFSGGCFKGFVKKDKKTECVHNTTVVNKVLEISLIISFALMLLFLFKFTINSA